MTVYSNDPANPRFQLKISGLVDVVAAFDPERMDLKKIAKSTTITKTAKLIGKDLKKLKISEVNSTKPDMVKAELIEEDGQQAVRITVTSKDKAERISARVTAKTNLEQPKEIQLYVYGQVTEDLVVNRTYVLFPRANEKVAGSILARNASALAAPFLDRGLTVNLRVTSLSEKPFRIEEVTDPEGAVVGFAQPEEKGWKVVLLLASKPKTSRGKVSLKTDRADQPSIDVRYGVRSMAGAGKHPRGMRDRGRSMPPIRLDPTQRLSKDGKRLKLAPRMPKPALKSKPVPKMVKPKAKKLAPR